MVFFTLLLEAPEFLGLCNGLTETVPCCLYFMWLNGQPVRDLVSPLCLAGEAGRSLGVAPEGVCSR